MTLGEMIEMFRNRADDTVEPFYWSDAEVVGYANDAQNFFCQETRLLLDSSTAAICELDVVHSQSEYAIDPRILYVDGARLAGMTIMLVKRERSWMDNYYPNWRADTCDRPENVRFYMVDPEVGKVWLYPAPSATFSNIKLYMTVMRLPLVQFTLDDLEATPDIHMMHHTSLIEGMLWRAYLKPDAGTFNEKAAAASESLFMESIEKEKRKRIVRETAESHFAPTNVWI